MSVDLLCLAATQAVQDTKWLKKAIKHNNFWSEKIYRVLRRDWDCNK